MLIRATKNNFDNSTDPLRDIAAAYGGSAIYNGWAFEADDTEAEAIVEALEGYGYDVDLEEDTPSGGTPSIPKIGMKADRIEKMTFPKDVGAMKMPRMRFGSRKPQPRGRKSKYGADDVARDQDTNSGYPDPAADGLPGDQEYPGDDGDTF